MKLIITIIMMLCYQLTIASEKEDELSPYSLNYFNPLYEYGISISAEYIGELWALENQSKIEMYNPNVINGEILFDLDKLIGIPNSEFEIYTLSMFGKDPNEDFASQQGITNIGAYNTSKIFQCFYEQNILDNRLQFIVGLLDVNSEFDVKFSAKNFINPSHGIGIDWSQSGANGPSIFPTASLGARVRFLHKGNIVMQFAILDGIPGDTANPNGTQIILNENDGLMVAGTIYHLHGESLLELPDNVYPENFEQTGIGFWYYTDKYSHVVSNITNWGIYFVFEQDAYVESNTSQGLSFFGRFGIADDKYNEVDYFIGLGGVYKGLIVGRDNDYLGLAIANAHNSFEYRTLNNLDDNEFNIEFFYIFNVTNFLNLQIDLQSFSLADQTRIRRDEILAGFRLKLSL